MNRTLQVSRNNEEQPRRVLVVDDEADLVSPDPIDVIFVDHEISPSQARHLENEVSCQVMDRTMVILEIFHRNARSPAARAQVEIARLGYLAPRLREALGRMLTSSRGIAASADEILVTRGSQMAFFLAAQALLANGDAVAVEALSHRGA